MQRDSPFQLRTESDSEAKTLNSIQIAEGTLQQTQSSSLKAGRQMSKNIDFTQSAEESHLRKNTTPTELQQGWGQGRGPTSVRKVGRDGGEHLTPISGLYTQAHTYTCTRKKERRN